MKLNSNDVRRAFDAWIAAVSGVAAHLADALSKPRALTLEGTAEGAFRLAGNDKHEFRLVDGALVDGAGALAHATFRGARVALNLPPDMFLFRDLDFPSKAIEFLDGVLRAQIDRLTPWSPAQAVFGHSAPISTGLDRIKLVMAAAPLAQVEPIVRALGAAGANSVVVAARREASDAAPIPVSESAFSRERATAEAQRGLRAALLGALAFAGISAAASGLLGAWFDARTEDTAAQTRQWRQAQMSGARDPDVMLHKRKSDTPLVVLVMEQLARILPDDTFLKELQFGEGKVEIAGVSGNATRLVGMLERSPTFSRATFSAPTTHAPNEPGDQFHIQAQVNARFGPGE